MPFPEIEVCSDCKEVAIFVRDVDGDVWVSKCCWAPAIDSDAVNLNEVEENDGRRDIAQTDQT